MVYIISKPTRREAEERRSESLSREGLNPKRYRGAVRTAEEAHDEQRKLERDGETFDKLWAVSNDSPEAKQADRDLKKKMGVEQE